MVPGSEQCWVLEVAVAVAMTMSPQPRPSRCTLYSTLYTVQCAPWPWLSRVRTQHPPQRWPEDFPRAVSMSIVTYGPMFKIGFQIPLPSATIDRSCCTGEHDSVCTLHTCIMHCHCIKIKNLPIAHKYLDWIYFTQIFIVLSILDINWNKFIRIQIIRYAISKGGRC